MTGPWDVVVSGGGPAGAATAAFAAEGGARVCLVERARFPRDKVCGEFVSAEGCLVLRRLGVLETLVARGARWIRRCRLSDGRARRVEAGLPELRAGVREALAVSRALLDTTLVERSLAAGVHVLERHEVLAPVYAARHAAGVRVRPVGDAGGGRLLAARVDVAADGRRSTLGRALDRRAGDPLRTGPRSWFGMKTHLTGGADALGDAVELHCFDGGYAGLVAVDGDRINACLVARVAALRSCGGEPGRLFAERVLEHPSVRDRVGGASAPGPWLTVGPLTWGTRRPESAGVLFVGDAAGTIDPFTGEGMSHALRAAEILEPHLKRAVADGCVSPSVGRSYRRAWNAQFARATRRARALGWLLERSSLARPVLRLLAAGPPSLVPWLVARTRTGPGP